MQTLTRFSLILAFAASAAFGQLATQSTTLAVAIPATSSQSAAQWCLASAVGTVLPSVGSPGTYLFVDQEAAQIIASGYSANCFRVKRGQLGTSAGSSHNAGATVWVGNAAPGSNDSSRPFTGVFVNGRPNGGCVASLQYSLPVIVAGGVQGGELMTCSGPANAQTWTPVTLFRLANVGAPIASAATIAPASYVTHVTGAAAVATITVPAGFNPGSQLVIVPDGAFTTVTTGNISATSTAVVGKALTFTYDGVKFNPSY